MMTLQEISDRLEIEQLLSNYSFAIDDRDWDGLDDIFTPDAFIDYTAAGGISGSLSEIKAWLPGAMARFPMFQHMVATTQLVLEDDIATSRTILFNPMVYRDEDGVEDTFFIGLWYRDNFMRTDAGWRITKRVEEKGWTKHAPRLSAS